MHLLVLLACTATEPGDGSPDTGSADTGSPETGETHDSDSGDTDTEDTDSGADPCTAPANTRTEPTDAEVVAADASNALGLQLLRMQETDNPFLAPLNIATALGLLYAGTGTQTAEEIAALIGDPALDGSVHQGLAGLSAALETASGDPDAECPTWTFSAANNAFVDLRLDLKAPYLATLADPYGVTPLIVDYEHDAAGAADTINDWVSAETAGHIDDIVAKEQFDYHTLLVLGSAVYFGGSWVTPFVHEATQDLRFNLADGTSVTTTMMQGGFLLRSVGLPGALAVELPYRGDDLAFVLVVPDEVAGVEAVLAALSPADISPAAFDAGGYGEVALAMPRFEVEATLALAKDLAAAGMPTAFDPALADLSPTADPPASTTSWCRRLRTKAGSRWTKRARRRRRRP